MSSLGFAYRRAAVRGRLSRSLVLSACAGVSLIASTAIAQTLYIGPPAANTAGFPADSNKWSNSSNWLGAVPNAVDTAVEVNYNVATEVEIDGVFTVGSLAYLGDATGAALTTPTKPTAYDATKGLTFATSAGTPTINVSAANGTLWYYNSLFGAQGFQKTGPGKLTFRFNTLDHTYTGDVRIAGGVLGINQNGSLGAASNGVFLGATDGPSTTATLTAEPGNDTGNVVIPATRSFTLNGIGAQLSTRNPANDQRVRMQIDSAIGETNGSFGYTMTGGLVTVTGANTYTGNTAVNGGALVLGSTASAPGFNTAGKFSANGGSLIVRMGGASDWSMADFNTLKANTTFAGAAALGIDTTNATGVVDWAGLTGGEAYSIGKVGAGTLRITGVNNYTGTRARIWDGTLALAPGASLPNNVTAIFFRGTLASPPTLDLGGNTQTLAGISPAVNSRSVITNGSLIIGADANFAPLNTNASGTTIDLTGLSSFTFDKSTRNFLVQPATVNNASGNGTIVELQLAGGTNLIRANTVTVGAATGTSQGVNHEGRLLLGTNNDVQITAATNQTMQIGGFNGTGRVAFQTGLTNPTFKLRAGDGTSPVVLLRIGETSSGVRAGGGTLDLSLGNADIKANDIVLSRHIAVSGNGESSSFSMGGGTVEATRLILGQKVNGGANPPSPTFNDPTLNSTVTINGGTFTAGTVLLGDAAVGTGGIPTPGATKYVINVNLNSGGTLRAGSIANLTGTLVNAFSEAASARNFNFNGGVLTHLAGQDLTVAGTASTDADPLTTGNLITVRVPATNTGGILVDAGRKVTLADTVRITNSGGATPTAGLLAKTGAGGLQINGAIDPTVGLKVDGGAAQVSNGTVLARADVNATLVVDYASTSVLADVKANIVAGYNGGTWDGATGYISSQAAASAGAQALGYAEASDVYGPGGATVAGLTVDGSAVVVMKTLAGDFTLDKTVNFDDLLKLAANYNGTSTGWTTGDANYDGVTNFDDLLKLASNYNQTLTGSLGGDWALAQSAVPEPTSLLAIGAAGAAVLRRRRR